MATRFQNVVLAFAPRSVGLNNFRKFTGAAHKLQDFHGSQWSTYHTGCFGRTQDCEGATVTLSRGVDDPGMVFWQDSGSSRRNSLVDPGLWNPENGVL
eukprot:7007241-Pyramimonas_sp.AAC.1